MNPDNIMTIAGGFAFMLVLYFIIISRNNFVDRKDSLEMNHVPPTGSVHKKAIKLKGGFVEGVYRCIGCNFAGHFYSVGSGPCPHCGAKIKKFPAKWDKGMKRWVFE